MDTIRAVLFQTGFRSVCHSSDGALLASCGIHHLGKGGFTSPLEYGEKQLQKGK
jgi:hypothetical protein